MDSAFIHQAANELVQTAGTRNIKQIARSCSLDISETSRIKDMLGLLSLYFDKPFMSITIWHQSWLLRYQDSALLVPSKAPDC